MSTHHEEVPEEAMTELSRFWSSLARRKFEGDRSSLPSLRATQQPRRASTQTWEELTAEDVQKHVVSDNSYSSKRSEREVGEVSQVLYDNEQEFLHDKGDVHLQESLVSYQFSVIYLWNRSCKFLDLV